MRPATESLAPLLVRVAAREAEDGRCYLRELIRGPWLGGRCQGPSELESLAELACDSLADFRELLRSELLPRATGPLGCGEEHLLLRLAELHFLDADAKTVEAALARALARVEDGIRRCPAPSRSVAGPGPREPAQGSAAVDGSGYQALCDQWRQEIEASGLVTLPQAPLRLGIRPQCPGVGAVRRPLPRLGRGCRHPVSPTRRGG